MNASKPRLAIVSSHNICCALAYYADALKEFLCPSFEIEIIDLKTSHLLRKEGKHYEKLSKDYIDQLCLKLQEFDLVNIHLELGLFGTSIDLISSRILKICQASGRLILTVHTIDYKEGGEHTFCYQQIMNALKKRPNTNPYHLIAHLPQEKALLQQHFAFENVTDFPLIYLTNARRQHFQQARNPVAWKKQFGFKEEDKTIGVFGLISPHKNYIHALRTLKLLPSDYKLLIIGEAHHMSIKEWQVDPTVQEMMTFLDQNPLLADRVFFTGKRPDEKYYEDLANIDFVLLSSFEVKQSGSATFSNALELSCSILKSNTSNAREYDIYFPNCFEVFDIGNYYEAKDKILNFDKKKIENLRKQIHRYSEQQIRKIYVDIYELMKLSSPVPLTDVKPNFQISREINLKQNCKNFLYHSRISRAIFKRMPPSVQSFLKKVKKLSMN